MPLESGVRSSPVLEEFDSLIEINAGLESPPSLKNGIISACCAYGSLHAVASLLNDQLILHFTFRTTPLARPGHPNCGNSAGEGKYTEDTPYPPLRFRETMHLFSPSLQP